MASKFALADCYVKPHAQPCWDCVKACGGCSWSSKLKPIPGWRAEKSIKFNSDGRGSHIPIETYKILYCPEYEQEARRDSPCY